MSIISGYLLPPGSEFSAVVDGRPTGLAGCTRAGECSAADTCLRADPALTYRARLGDPGPACPVHILRADDPRWPAQARMADAAHAIAKRLELAPDTPATDPLLLAMANEYERARLELARHGTVVLPLPKA